MAARRAAAATRKPKASRYAGVEASNDDKSPMPEVGEYRFRVGVCQETVNDGNKSEWFNAKLEIVTTTSEHHQPGDELTFLQGISGPAARPGLPRVKSFVMASYGFDDEGEYDKFDPEGGFIDSTVGEVNQYTEDGEVLEGRLVDCTVTRGNPVMAKAEPGKAAVAKVPADYYRNYQWFPVPEDEQEAPAE